MSRSESIYNRVWLVFTDSPLPNPKVLQASRASATYIPPFLEHYALLVVNAQQVLGFIAWLRGVMLPCQKLHQAEEEGALGSKEDLTEVRSWAQGEEG